MSGLGRSVSRRLLQFLALAAAAVPVLAGQQVILLATTFWHEAGTSIGRYHYMLIPFALLLAGQVSGRQGKEEKPS